MRAERVARGLSRDCDNRSLENSAPELDKLATLYPNVTRFMQSSFSKWSHVANPCSCHLEVRSSTVQDAPSVEFTHKVAQGKMGNENYGWLRRSFQSTVS